MNIGGGGNRVSINDLARAIAKATGFDGSPNYEDPRIGDVRDSLADISRAQNWMGWNPGMDLDEGIALTVASFETRRAATS